MKSNLLPTLLFILLCTTANGQIWKKQNLNFPKATQGGKIKPVGDQVAWSIGFPFDENGQFIEKDYPVQKTINSGDTWTTLTFPQGDEGFLSDLFAVSEAEAYVSYVDYNSGSFLYKTINGGTSWEDQQLPINTWLNWVYYFTKDYGVAMGDANDNREFQILITEDGGKTWTQVIPDNIPLAIEDDEYGESGEYTVQGDDIWFLTSYARVFHSSDKGNTWEVFDFNLDLLDIPWGICSDNKKNIYLNLTGLLDNSFKLYRRSLSDNKWINLTPSNNQKNIAGLTEVPGTEILIANTYSDFSEDSTFETHLSFDQGSTFKKISQGDRAGFISFSNQKTGYSSHIYEDFNNPSIYAYKYSGSPITWIKNLSKENANITAGPNPTSDYLNIKWNSELDRKLQITILNSSGQVVHNSLEKFIANEYKTIRLDQYPTGLYGILISDENSILTVQEIVKK